jgi:hypothetical protein
VERDDVSIAALLHNLCGGQIARWCPDRELSRETAEGHVLFAESVSAVAACGHCDDVLIALDDGRFACVHLTYVRSAPDRLPWPDTKFLDDWRRVVEYVEAHDEL